MLKGTQVSAYASPEGEISLNEDLAMERAESANAAVAKLLKRAKIDVEEGFFGNNPKGEDWEGFQELMRASDIEDKDLILRVLSMYSDKNRREEEIKNIAKTYKEIEKEILPALRRSMITVNYDIEGYTDEELKAIAMASRPTSPSKKRSTQPPCSSPTTTSSRCTKPRAQPTPTTGAVRTTRVWSLMGHGQAQPGCRPLHGGRTSAVTARSSTTTSAPWPA